MALEPEHEDQDIETAMKLHRRYISEEQWRMFEGYMTDIFTALGLNLHTPATYDTQRRFLRAMFDATEGYEGDPKLLKVFEIECRSGPNCRLSQVVEGRFTFFPCASTMPCARPRSIPSASEPLWPGPRP